MLLTVKKIGPVLDLFSVERPEWGVTEVAERLGTAKSSAHALLVSLGVVDEACSIDRLRLDALSHVVVGTPGAPCGGWSAPRCSPSR